jgi:hypothetical protein
LFLYWSLGQTAWEPFVILLTFHTAILSALNLDVAVLENALAYRA